MLELQRLAAEREIGVPDVRQTDYLNTIAPENEPEFPATSSSSAASALTCGGTRRSWFTGRNDPESALVATFQVTRPPHRYTKLG